MMKQPFVFILTVFVALVFLSPSAFAANRIDVTSIKFSDTQPTIGDVVRVDFEFDVDANRYSKVNIYLYVDGKLYEKRVETLRDGDYKRSLYIDTYDLERGTYNVKIEAKIYDEDERVDDTDTKNKYLYVKGEIIDSRICYHYYDDYYDNYYLDYSYDGYCYTYTPIVRTTTTKDHNIAISQISYDHSASKYDKIPIKVYVKNSGDYTESVKITIEIDGVTKTTDRELIYPGDEHARIVYFTAPSTTGTHQVRIKATSYYDQHIVEDFIDVIGTTVSLNINPKTAKMGEWIHVYGYAMDDTRGITTPVSIYKDSTYVEQVSVKPTGYYSAYVRFYESGEHMIRVRASGIEKTKQIYIEYVAPVTTTYVAQVTPVTDTNIDSSVDTTKTDDSVASITPQTNITNITDSYNTYNTTNTNITNKYYTIVVVTDENKTIDVDGTDIKITVEKPVISSDLSAVNGEIATHMNDLPEYVDVGVNSKIRNIEQYGGNTLKLTITNHMSDAKLFSVETTFDEKQVYVPGSSIIMPGETKVIPLYFSARGNVGKYDGIITVLKNNETIKEIPITIYSITSKKETEITTTSNLFNNTTIIAAVFLIFLVSFSYFMIKRKTRRNFEQPIEPKLMRPYVGRYMHKYKIDPETAHFSNDNHRMRKKAKELYSVPWENVIY